MRSHPYEPPPPVPAVLEPLANELSTILPNQRSYLSQNGSSSDSSYSDNDGLLLRDLNPDTSKLLPVKQKKYHVRVQGRLAAVRSVSTGNLRQKAQAEARRQSQMEPVPTIAFGLEDGAWKKSTLLVQSDALRGVMQGDVQQEEDESTGSNSPKRLSVLKKGQAARRQSRFESGVAGEAVRPRKRRKSIGDVPAVEVDTEGSEEDDLDISKRDTQLRGYGIGGAGNIRRPTEVMYFPSSQVSPRLAFLDASMMRSSSHGPSDKRRWHIRDFFGLSSGRKGKAVAA